MSITSVQNLLNNAVDPNSPGGERIWKLELKDAWTEAQPASGEAIPPEVSALFEDLVDDDLSHGARRLLGEIMDELATQPQAPTSPSTQLNPGTAPKYPVFLNATSWPVADSTLQGVPAADKIEEGFYRLALLVSHANEGGFPLDAIANMQLGQKSALVDKAIQVAEASKDPNSTLLAGLDAEKQMQARSSAFTVLYYLGKSLVSQGPQAALNSRVHTAMVDMTMGEDNKWLGKHMAQILSRRDYKNSLSTNQVASCNAAFEAHHPQKFDVGNILDSEGYITWEHIAGQGEGFVRSFSANLVKQAIGGENFKKTAESWGEKDFELTFSTPRGDQGRVKGVRIKIKEFRDDMFDSVGKNIGISYGGHSNIGLNQEASLERAIARGLTTAKPQIALLDLCAGLDNLDDDMKALGNLEVLTTYSSSYFWKGEVTDDQGTFDGVRDSEGMRALMAMFDGLSKEHNYEQMRTAVSREIYSWQHSRNPNIVFPTAKDYQEVRWMHLDGDADGKMDTADVFFQFDLAKVAHKPATEFVWQDNGPAHLLDGSAVKNAILDLNVATHYNSSTHGRSQFQHNFVANGYFDGTPSDPPIRFHKAKVGHTNKQMIFATVNSGLAHTSREALSALTQYQSILHGNDEGLISTLSETDSKLLALSFAGFRLNYDSKSRSNDQRVWAQMLGTLNLPLDLPYGPMAHLLDEEHHDYAGSLKIVEEYKKSIPQASLDALADKEIGRWMPPPAPPVVDGTNVGTDTTGTDAAGTDTTVAPDIN